jgi:hypothetical protein
LRRNASAIFGSLEQSSIRHVSAVKIGTQADVLGAN